VVESTGARRAHHFKQVLRNVISDDLSTEKERTLGFLKRVVGADGSVKLDKDKVVRKLEGNADAARHKVEAGRHREENGSGCGLHGAARRVHLSHLCADDSKKPRKYGGHVIAAHARIGAQAPAASRQGRGSKRGQAALKGVQRKCGQGARWRRRWGRQEGRRQQRQRQNNT